MHHEVHEIRDARDEAQRCALLGAAHPGPAFAVTLLAGLLAGAVGLGPGRIALVVAAVLTGQLSIGWSNDLIDLRAGPRGRTRTDKPLATAGVVRADRPHRVRVSRPSRPSRCRCSCGWVAGLVHLVCVASGWAYNLGAEVDALVVGCRTPSRSARLPVFVSLADNPTRCPRCGCRSPARCSASARTSSTCCPTSPTTRRPASAGCRTGSAPGGARWSRPRCSVGAQWSSWSGRRSTPWWSRSSPWSRRRGAGGRRAGRHGRTPFRAAIAMALVDVAMLVLGPMTTTTATGTSSSSAPGRPARGRARRPARRPGAAGAAAGPGRLPARQVLRRRHRPARASTRSAAIGVTGVEDGWTPLTRLELARGDASVAGTMARPVYVIPREVFDARLVERAVDRGATLPPAPGRDVGHGRGVVLDGRAGHRSWSARTARTPSSARHLGLPDGRRALAIRGYAPTPPDRRGTQVIRVRRPPPAGVRLGLRPR